VIAAQGFPLRLIETRVSIGVISSKVYFVDDDEFFLNTYSQILRRAGLDVLTYLSAEELLKDLKPDTMGCILADLDMPMMNGLCLQKAIQQSSNPLPFVFLTACGDIPSSVQAMRYGAEDFLTKGSSKDVLITAIHRAFARNEEERVARAKKSNTRQMLALLTDREREVLKHVIQGKLNKQIADDLSIHERTVKLHRTSITTKLGMPSVAELTKFWIEAESSEDYGDK
jgi:two-component system, LuxR family, response regulator FixJ